MQLLYSKPIMNVNFINGPMLVNNSQLFAKYEHVGYSLPMMSPRMHLPMDAKPRKRRTNHSLVATMDPVAVARRNERERNRVKQVNDGFDSLRKKVPFLPDKKKLSKVEILRYAMMYIRDLKSIVEEYDQNNVNKRKNSESSNLSEEGSIEDRNELPSSS
ncbi:achaete-scute homolog 1a-like [Hydractinia symbiolongicarpus]|uniref:achaete-scute homolog 1a-like n=1 Tax=Hydractinia symbiolongicarpus TaxID=13093 RepID=UPI002551B5DC|nr:achaete-scute homolog 1a-like [Hydractinia symbiolongicarpus]